MQDNDEHVAKLLKEYQELRQLAAEAVKDAPYLYLLAEFLKRTEPQDGTTVENRRI